MDGGSNVSVDSSLSCARCGKPADLQCPKCLELKLPRESASFCTQECFKASWSSHKTVHLKSKLSRLTASTPDEQNSAALNDDWLYCLKKGQARTSKLPNFDWTGPLRPYPISSRRVVPASIEKPDWFVDGIPKIEPNSDLQHVVEIKTPEQIERMRETCHIAREVLDAAAHVIKPGVTTDEIDEVVHEATIAAGGYPSPLNYHFFPKSCCTSVNEVICHGIPDARRLEDGDIVNVDVTVYYKGVTIFPNFYPTSMELWLLIFISFLSIFLAVILNHLLTTPNGTKKKENKRNLPPGPPSVPILGNLLWLTRSLFELEPILRQLRPKYGPIISLRVGSRTLVFITDASVAHKALVQKGSAFSDRPPALEAGRIMNSNQHNISSAFYGPLWRLLRRNLMSEILHPSRVRAYAQGRKWVLDLLTQKLTKQADSGEPVCVVESFQYSMFCLLLLMCFGQKLDKDTVKKIETTQRRLLLNFRKFNVFAFLPRIGKLIFRKRWNELLEMRHDQEQALIPLIRSRKERQQDHEDGNKTFIFGYVDSLLDLELPEEGGRKLTEGEMVTLCSEFLNAGTDTTSTSLQWIMANLVKHQDLQQKLVEEIEGVVGKEAEEVGEEDLNRMPYLKAVIMEGLRRHPPGHFVLPHAVSEEVTLEEYVIPKEATVNFMVADMGWDEKVWEEPMAFKPERFLDGGENVDITGSREIKMMPFGAGRRICPGLNLAMLHLEYFVANLVREFEWKTVEGEEVDLTEKQEFTTVMKKPLKARIIQRTR